MKDLELEFPDDDRLRKPLRDLWNDFLDAIQSKGRVLEVTNRGFDFVATGERQSREFLFTPRTLRDLSLESAGTPDGRLMPALWFLGQFDEFIDCDGGKEPYDYPYVIVRGFGEFFASHDGVEPKEWDTSVRQAEIEAHFADMQARIEEIRRTTPLWRRIAYRKQTGWFAANSPEEAQRLREARRTAEEKDKEQ